MCNVLTAHSDVLIMLLVTLRYVAQQLLYYILPYIMYNMLTVQFYHGGSGGAGGGGGGGVEVVSFRYLVEAIKL